MAWHDNITFRGGKQITTKGELFRRCLNSYRNNHKGGLSLVALATKCEIVAGRINVFISGSWEDIPEDLLITLLQTGLAIPYEKFKQLAKKTAIPRLGIYAQTISPTPAKPAPTPEVKHAVVKHAVTSPLTNELSKSKVKSNSKKISIVNHSLSGLIAIVSSDKSTITLYDNEPRIIKKLGKTKWVYIAPADEIGDKIVARTSII